MITFYATNPHRALLTRKWASWPARKVVPCTRWGGPSCIRESGHEGGCYGARPVLGDALAEPNK